MGYRSAHFNRQQVQSKTYRPRARNTLRKRGNTHRDQRDHQGFIDHLLKKATDSPEQNPFQRIFGVSSPIKALRIALRVKRMKRRDPAAPREQFVNPAKVFPRSVREAPQHLKCRCSQKCTCVQSRKRNVHHLTPESRKTEPFHGDHRCNILLIRECRHKVLHDEFDMQTCVRTWEEIITILARCADLDQRSMFAMFVEHFQKTLRLPKRRCRRLARRAMRKLQAEGSGKFSGAVFFLAGRAAGN